MARFFNGLINSPVKIIFFVDNLNHRHPVIFEKFYLLMFCSQCLLTFGIVGFNQCTRLVSIKNKP